MDHYKVIIAVIGVAALGMAWMPAFTKKTGISYALVYMILGAILYTVFREELPVPDPRKNSVYALHLSELVIIVSLMGTGIKIDRPFSFKTWQSPVRLIALAMIACVAIATGLGYLMLSPNMASALLLAAALAPTDPVLASDVQVGPPNEKVRFETKFALTAEAGMNDGLAMPFVLLAIAIANVGAPGANNLWHWLGYDLIIRMIIGLVSGHLIGRLLGYIVFRVSDKFKVLETRDGFVGLSLTLMVYGITELLHGYGFVAVFVAALTLRHYESGHQYHSRLHAFTDQTERIILAIVLILFGGSLFSGVLDALNWKMVMFSVLFLFFLRPLTSYLSLMPCKIHSREKWVISFYGIRGMGSIYYLCFATQEAHFAYANELWATVMFTILLSIIVHGLTATTVMKRMEERFAHDIKKHEYQNS
ncbi:cation:proton antiporter [Mucilaginibacter lacusdianchii]|uniref:cation:proton antiporter n=1 Tax=Mucilaginibacter lacusdianchii TaxID=2684211 RepID=UPI00131CEA85|nr:cation:proton antiporter [Mucilaginibacter sp. JXJ CY 39]